MNRHFPLEHVALAKRKTCHSILRRGTPRKMKHRALIVALMGFIVALYSYPALRTRWATKSDRLPVISAPDLALYLALSSLESPRPGLVMNPYYQIAVPETGAGFLKFRLGPILYGDLVAALSGRMWWSLFLWNAFWWALACIAAAWLFHRFLPTDHLEIMLLGLALLMFFNSGMMKEEIVAWLHLPSLATFGEIGLPYIRSFSPQVALPVLLAYLGLQMLVLERSKPWIWTLMFLLQLFALATFPYATLVMAGVTAIAGACQILKLRRASAWRAIAIYGLLCALVDIAFVSHGSGFARMSLPGASPLFLFQLSVLRGQMGKLWFFIGFVSAAVAYNRQLATGVRWTLVGLGVSNMLMLLGDAFVPGPPFFLTNHASYFEHATLAILLTFLIGAVVSRVGALSMRLRFAAAGVLCLLCVNGLLLAETGYRRSLPSNREQADLVNWFALGHVAQDDLVIAQHDTCGWEPFLSKAQVLFCRNAQAMLTPEQNRDLQRTREAWYLFFTGKGTAWMESTSADPSSVHRLETYGQYGEVSSYVGQYRTQQVNYIREQLLPALQLIETGDPRAVGFMQTFKRIWVIDSANSPKFATDRLRAYLQDCSEAISGGLVITSCRPK